MSPLGSFLRGGVTRPNAAPELRITLARRLVETPGAPFAPTGEVFTDIPSALDELGLLSALQGPTVVRVQVQGGTAADHANLTGDWLVDPEGVERVLRLPAPRWGYDGETKRWALERPWLEAWETCPNAAWVLAAAHGVGVERKLLVLAACACARTVLPFVPEGEVRPLRAIETAENWVRGEVTLDAVRAAASAADAAVSEADAYACTIYETVSDSAYTAADSAAWAAAAAHASAHAAASAATTFDDASSDDASSDATVWAADAADDAADAVGDPNAAEVRAAAMARLADLVRRVIPTLVVLRAVTALQYEASEEKLTSSNADRQGRPVRSR